MQFFGRIKDIQPAGIDGVIIYFHGDTLTDKNDAVQAMARGLKGRRLSWIKSLIAGYDSLLVLFDLQRADTHLVYGTLRQTSPREATQDEHSHYELPVWYGASGADDFAVISEKTGLGKADIISLHANQTFKVFTVGFSPGFAYMGELDEALRCPRLASPRKKVPAGAVAIADRQTAVYPNASPGGWNLLGRCPLPLFKADGSQPVTLRAGDTVTFTEIDEATFKELSDAHG